ncbi:hydroxyneurosporene dehydrogenase [Streptomyces cacaoi]|uniref:hydroxyneurosporene dehydrogenase n=1 Tax=Streptomyces cacaoi TaxID=1898 RepID=UPI002605113F|nr:hydroxyneurosporene dehydrogenase [Streptomyces cacaoi]
MESAPLLVPPAARQAESEAEYVRLGLARDRVEAWEDAARTDNSPGSYEWWYLDAHLDDGAKLVVVFMNKHFSSAQDPLRPLLRINVELPGGELRTALAAFAPEQWSASSDSLDVRAGGNRMSGDLDTVRVRALAEGIAVDLELHSRVGAWRPQTGHMYFGEGTDRLFAWLPAIPQGEVSGSYTVDGETRPARGTGYHDHNWGHVPLPSVINDWYWARGQAGPYATIATYITATAEFAHATIPIFLLTRDGEIVADDARKVRFEAGEVRVDAHTGKPVADVTRYRYADGPEEYTVTFVRERDLSRRRMVDNLTGERRARAEAAGFDGAYLRFAGTLTIERHRDGLLVESYRDEAAIWELMYFGRARRPRVDC